MKRMGRKLISLLVTTVMLFTGMPAAVMADGGFDTAVSGRIIDSVTREGLSGATVSLGNDYKDTTDAFGFYQIDGPAAGTYDISASLRGYTGASQSNFVIDGKMDWSAELAPDQGNPCVDIYANIKCVYSGIALSGVTVTAKHSTAGDFTAKTDEEGTLIFDNLPKGSYTFEINKTGQPGWESYTSKEYPVTQDQLLNCSLKPNYESLTVKTSGFDAFSEQNGNVRNVTVRLYGVDPKNHDVELITTAPRTTGADGTVTFDNLVPIDWRIEAYSPGYDSIDDVIVKALPDGNLEQDTVNLNMNFHPAGLIINLESPYDDNEIYEGLEVDLCGINDTSTEGLTRSVTLGEGETSATFNNLLPGQYSISTYGNAERNVPIEVGGRNIYLHPGLDRWVSPERVFYVNFQGQTPAVAEQDRTLEVELLLAVEKANYSGFLYKTDMDENGELITTPASNVEMKLAPSEYYPMNPEKTKTYTVTTDAYGHYSFNVYPGLYGVTISGMDDYWGAYINYRERYTPSQGEGESEGESSYSTMGGWPYAGIWQSSYESAIAYMCSVDNRYSKRTGYADIGGMPLSSGTTEGDLYMKEKVCSVELDVQTQSISNTWQYTLTGEVDTKLKPNDFRFIRTKFDSASYKSILSCNEKRVDTDEHPLPYTFTNLKPGTHNINLTQKPGVRAPKFILEQDAWVDAQSYIHTVVWNGQTIDFYNFPAPGVLPADFPADYDAKPAENSRNSLDAVWPTGHNRIALNLRGEEEEFDVKVLSPYIFRWDPPSEHLGEIRPGRYYNITEIQPDRTLYHQDFWIYGWSSDIIPNVLFRTWIGGDLNNRYQRTMRIPSDSGEITLYLTKDPSGRGEYYYPREWAEMTFNPATGEASHLNIGGPQNNVRKGPEKYPAIFEPFILKVRAKHIYTGELIDGITVPDIDSGKTYTSGNDYPNQITTPTFRVDDINMGGKKLRYTGISSLECDYESRTYTYTLDLEPNIAIDLTVKDGKGTPIPGAAVVLKSTNGFDENLHTQPDGKLRRAYLKDENYTLTIDAPGYNTFTHELKTGALRLMPNKWHTFALEAVLTPLSGPDITEDDFDRYGGFLPHAGRVTSGDNYELACFLMDGENPAKEALTLTIEAALKQKKHNEVYDKVIGMYIIDGKKFDAEDKSREGDYSFIDMGTLPDTSSPESVKEWLGKLNSRADGLENVFFRYFDAEAITQGEGGSGMADFAGEIMIYDLPAGPFKPIFIAVTEKGAYNIYVPDIDEKKQLVGLKKEGFLTFFHEATEMYLDKRSPVVPTLIVPFFEFCPAISEATNLPEFSAEIAEDEDNPGYLVYDYSIAVTADGGMANPGGASGSPTSYLPDNLGIEFGGTLSASVSGKDLSIENKAQISAAAEFETEKYLPAAISDVATMEGKATGTGSFTSGIEYENDAKPSIVSSDIGLAGEIETTTDISGVGVAGKLFGGGTLATVFRTIKKWGIDLGVTIGANIGLGVDFGMKDNLKTPTAPDELNLNTAIGLGAKAGVYGNAFKGNAGARGTIGFGGEHPSFESSMMTFEVKFVYDVEKGEFRVEPAELKGVCEAEFEAFINTPIFSASKVWNFEAFTINMQFGTETQFTLTPIGIKGHEISRDTFGTSTFMADEGSGTMVRDYLKLATYAADENGSGSFLYTDLASAGGDMRLQLSRYSGGAWRQPVTVVTTDGAMGSYDLLTLPDGRILITYNLIAKEDMYNSFPNSKIMYVLGNAGENGWTTESSGTVAQLDGSYALSSHLVGGADPRLVCGITGGAGAEGFGIQGYNWNGNGFGAATNIKNNIAGYGMSVAETGGEVIIAYSDRQGKLHAVSWTNAVTDTEVATNDAGSASAVTADEDGFYLVCAAKGGIEFYTRAAGAGSGWVKKGASVSNTGVVEADLASSGGNIILSYIKPSEANYDAAGKLVAGKESIMSVTLSKEGRMIDALQTQKADSMLYRNLSVVHAANSVYAFAVDTREATADLVFKKLRSVNPNVDFIGRVTITGDERLGGTLTATVSDDSSVSKKFTYSWKRGGENIAAGASYQIAAEDLGKTLICEVRANDRNGTISAATGVIGKSVDVEAPTGLAVVKPSVKGASDGKIIGTDRSMEYSRSEDGEYTPCRGDAITDLSAGTYYIRVRGTGTTEAGPYSVIIIEDGPAPEPSPGNISVKHGEGDEAGTETEVSVDIDGNTATVGLSAEDVEGIINSAQETGDVTLQCDTGQNIDTVVLNTDALNKVSEEANKADTNVTGFTVQTDTAAVSLDAAALKSLTEQAAATADDTISIHVAQIDESKLTEEQQTAIANEENAVLLEITIKSGDTEISQYGGGKITVRMPYGIAPGQNADDLKVWHVAADGTMTQINCQYDAVKREIVFTVDHLSNYMLTGGQPEYHVKVTDDGHGTGAANPGYAVKGTEITLVAVADPGWNFKEWQVVSPAGLEINNNKFTMPGEPVEVKAIFEKKPATEYTVTVYSGTADRNKATKGTKVTINANPAPNGQQFKEWDVPSSVQFTDGTTKRSSTAKFIMPERNVTATARYQFTGGGGTGGDIGGGGTGGGGTGGDIGGGGTGGGGGSTGGGGGGGLTPTPSEKPETPTKPETPKYNDVKKGDWFEEAVNFVTERKLMVGTGEGNFSPTEPASRGMIATILYRLEKEPAASGEKEFPDVKTGMWYSNAVKWAAENKIVSGYTDGNFGPDDNITREQLAAILYRYACYKEFDVSGEADLTKFKDADKVSSWAKDAMAWANAKGIITGKGNGILDPGGNAERAEIAAMLQRFCKLYEL